MTGEMLKPLEGRPYLEQWKERLADQKPSKMVEPKPRKKGRKKARK